MASIIKRKNKYAVVYNYLIINNSLTDHMTVTLPADAVTYTLSGNGDIRSATIYLNGAPLVAENGELLVLHGAKQNPGAFQIAPGDCSFIVL